MWLAFKAFLLGVIQGLTEFLPISSTGHMIIVDEYLRLPEGFRETFLVVVQLGSILSVLVYFRRKLFPVELFHDAASRMGWIRLWLKVAFGVLPALIVGGLWGSAIKAHLYSVGTVALALFLGGVVLIVLERRRIESRFGSISELPWSRAFGIGVAQCLAMIPGVSRSAATIVGGLCLGASRELAVEYSFFLAIPTMFAASAYSLLKEGAAMTASQWGATAVGFAAAFVVAWAVIALFMSFIRRRDFQVFGWYRIALALVLLAWLRWLRA